MKTIRYGLTQEVIIHKQDTIILIDHPEKCLVDLLEPMEFEGDRLKLIYFVLMEI